MFRGKAVLAAAVVCAAGVIAPVGSAEVTAGAASAPPVVAGSGYLALGDSVSFGYREPTTSPAPNYKDAANFVGFPEVVASDLGLRLANLSCPGETTASFLNPKAPSNGCESHPNSDRQVVAGGYRTFFPLHEKYAGSQLAAAVSYLKAHRGTRLVTLMTGANDFFLCQQTTADGCASEAERAAVFTKLGANLKTIVNSLRKAGYRGQIMLVGYYSLDYANSLDNAASQAIDAAIEKVASALHTEYANGYSAWATASRFSGGDPCTAGLLTQLYANGKPSGKCGIHPSPAGADALASIVERTMLK